MIVLGTPVVYHHRAAVARYQSKGGEGFGWFLYEGCNKEGMDPKTFTPWNEMFIDFPQVQVPKSWSKVPSKVNKTIMVWPEEGSGIVTGKVRRQIGISHRSSGGGGMYDHFDPGYFDPFESHELYVVRHRLEGQNFILVPMWAAIPMQLGGGSNGS